MADEPCPDCITTSPGEDCPNCGTLVSVASDDMQCPVCSNIIPADAEVCPHCGTEFEWYDDLEETGLLCPDCSTPILVGQSICSNCGVEFVFEDEEAIELAEAVAPPPVAVATGKEKKKRKDKAKDKNGKDKAKDKNGKRKGKVKEESKEAVVELSPEPAEIPKVVTEKKKPLTDSDEIDEEMDLDAEIERIEAEESIIAQAAEAELTPEEIQALFDRSLEEMGNPYDVQNPTSEYSQTIEPVMQRMELANSLGAIIEEADRLLDTTYILAKKRDFPAAVRMAKEALQELEKQIEDALFYRQFEISESLSHVSQETADEARQLLQEMTKAQSAKDQVKAAELLSSAAEVISRERPEFKNAEQLCLRLSRRVATAERFLVDTRDVRELMAHSRDYTRRGDWKSATQVCDGALKLLEPVIQRVAEQELDAVKAQIMDLKRGDKASEEMMAAVKDAKDFLEKGEAQPALEHIYRIKREIPKDA